MVSKRELKTIYRFIVWTTKSAMIFHIGLLHLIKNLNFNKCLFKRHSLHSYIIRLCFSRYCDCKAGVKVSRNGPERRSGERIIACTAFRLEFLVGWCYDADATIVVPGLY